MSKPAIGYRLFQIGTDREGKPVLLPGDLDAPSMPWLEPVLKGMCLRNPKHEAPVAECTCGVHAYRELERAIGELARLRPRPVVLAAVIGGGDRELQVHDAVWRAEEAHIIAFAAIGGGFRAGLVQEIAARMEIKVVPLESLQTEAARLGEPVWPNEIGSNKRFVEDLKPGDANWYSIAWSSLSLDQSGRCYVNADRSVTPVEASVTNDLDCTQSRFRRKIFVRRLTTDSVEIKDPVGFDGYGYVALPRDGELERRNGNRVFALRVGELRIGFNNHVRSLNASAVTMPLADVEYMVEFLPLGKQKIVEQVSGSPLVVSNGRLVLAPAYRLPWAKHNGRLAVTRRENGFEVQVIDKRIARIQQYQDPVDGAALIERPVVRLKPRGWWRRALSDDRGVMATTFDPSLRL